jgi:endonuclease YncB( thermonuclease family)
MLALLMALAISASQVEVVNSDTVFANGRPYRLYRVDAPQTDATCDLERLRAEHLAAVVTDLVSSAKSVEVRPGFDPRGRQGWPNDHRGTRLARIAVDGQDLGDILIARGLAYRWDNHNKRNWCVVYP